MHVCVLSCFSHVWLFANLWTVAHQAPLSMGFSRQEHWSGLSCPPPGDLPKPGIRPLSPALAASSLPLAPPGNSLKSIQPSSKHWTLWFWPRLQLSCHHGCKLHPTHSVNQDHIHALFLCRADLHPGYTPSSKTSVWLPLKVGIWVWTAMERSCLSVTSTRPSTYWGQGHVCDTMVIVASTKDLTHSRHSTHL